MSVLIKNLFGKDMPMPQEGYIDVRLHFKGSKIECATMPTGKKPFYATFDVEEVPTPNGRLIDADALLSDDEIVQILTSNPQRTGKLIKEFAEMFVDKVNRQPTIIEAEGSEE